MADDRLRTYRSRDPLADIDPVARGAASDPLAELARLIGQSDPVGEFGRDTRQAPVQTLGDAPAADDGYAETPDYPEDRDEQPRFAESSYHESRAYPAQGRDYDQEAPARYSRQPANYDRARDEVMGNAPRYRDDVRPVGSGRQLQALTPQSPDADYEAAEPEQWQDGGDGQSYAVEEYDEEFPGGVRRSGTVVVAAVLGLAMLGIAGAFAYRTMFGGAVLPSLPPIIKANEGPNKIIPSHSDAQADASSQGGVTNSTGDRLVSREEQPLNIQTPPSAAPRVVSTIPILSGPDAASQGAPPPVAATAPAAPAAAPPWPTPPPAAPAAVASAAAVPATAPKRVHTVIIRSDQSGGTADATVPSASQESPAPAPARAVAPRAMPRPVPTSGANAPLSIVPQQQDQAAPPPAPSPAPERTRVAREESTNAPITLGSATAPVPTPASGGGYSVQVSSQRSEEEAQAAFRSLQAKFPTQLGGRAPIIRRADLGEKGTYYRALVGPFASVEQAAEMCSSLKSAGGTCIVQRN
jgi:hypothetical protein